MKKPLSSNLLAPFEAIINRCIAQDVQLADGITRHSGKTLQLDITVPPVSLLVHFYPASVILAFASEPLSETSDPSGVEAEATVDGKISGSGLAMMGLLTERNENRSLVNPAIQISGDSDFVQSVYRLFLDMEVEWQEPLSRLIGDVPTHGLEQLLGYVRDFAVGTASSVKRNVDEYIHEESRMVPPLNQVDNFDRELDNLRLRLDRLQARIQRLSGLLSETDNAPTP